MPNNISLYPLADDFRAKVSQAYAGGTGTLNLTAVPQGGLPSGFFTLLTLNPGKTNQQVVMIDAIDTVNNTVNVSSINVVKDGSTQYTAKSHSIGSEVIISDNYAFRKAIVDEVNQNTFSRVYANAAARDAAVTSPENGRNSAYLTSEGYRTDYVAGAWVQRATGATPNAELTVAGKVELATDAEVAAGTNTGGSGPLAVQPSQVNPNIFTTKATPVGADTVLLSDSADSNKTKKATITSLAQAIPSSTSERGTVQQATDAEATTGTENTKYITSKVIGDYTKSACFTYTFSATTAQVITHGLGRTPKNVELHVVGDTFGPNSSEYRQTASEGYRDGTNQRCVYQGANSRGVANELGYIDHNGTKQRGFAVSSAGSTTITVTGTRAAGSSGVSLLVIIS